MLPCIVTVVSPRCCPGHCAAAGASLDGTLWRLVDSSSGFSPGNMLGSSKYDAASALAELASMRMHMLLDSQLVYRCKAPVEVEFRPWMGWVPGLDCDG